MISTFEEKHGFFSERKPNILYAVHCSSITFAKKVILTKFAKLEALISNFNCLITWKFCLDVLLIPDTSSALFPYHSCGIINVAVPN